jgi:hypothetical protein
MTYKNWRNQVRKECETLKAVQKRLKMVAHDMDFSGSSSLTVLEQMDILAKVSMKLQEVSYG